MLRGLQWNRPGQHDLTWFLLHTKVTHLYYFLELGLVWHISSWMNPLLDQYMLTLANLNLLTTKSVGFPVTYHNWKFWTSNKCYVKVLCAGISVGLWTHLVAGEVDKQWRECWKQICILKKKRLCYSSIEFLVDTTSTSTLG